MPSAVLSGAGNDFSSTPGPATGDPLSATYSVEWSGLTAIPRGRLPRGIVETTDSVLASMTDRSPDVSLVTYSRGPDAEPRFWDVGGAGPPQAVATPPQTMLAVNHLKQLFVIAAHCSADVFSARQVRRTLHWMAS